MNGRQQNVRATGDVRRCWRTITHMAAFKNCNNWSQTQDRADSIKNPAQSKPWTELAEITDMRTPRVAIQHQIAIVQRFGFNSGKWRKTIKSCIAGVFKEKKKQLNLPLDRSNFVLMPTTDATDNDAGWKKLPVWISMHSSGDLNF